MRESFPFKGRTALVTGASSGLGVEFARELARRGANLILVARRTEKLEEHAKVFRSQFNTEVRVHSTDLSRPELRQDLFDKLTDIGTRVDILVNNAGFGMFKHFFETDWNTLNGMIEVDITALTHLSYLFGNQMVKNKWGRILLVASTSSFQPVPKFSVYSAAKSYVLSFGIGLSGELKNSGVSCTTVCPGYTATEFFSVSGQGVNKFSRQTMLSAVEIADQAIDALQEQRTMVVTGFWNSMMAFGTRFVPRTWAAAIAKSFMK